ncbi:hypothetical protein HY994_06765 [Candidatus Micrarchaeota archaeon]|nr:hypothetical protein [Candidatus Micrarchaeota archaeon]
MSLPPHIIAHYDTIQAHVEKIRDMGIRNETRIRERVRLDLRDRKIERAEEIIRAFRSHYDKKIALHQERFSKKNTENARLLNEIGKKPNAITDAIDEAIINALSQTHKNRLFTNYIPKTLSKALTKAIRKPRYKTIREHATWIKQMVTGIQTAHIIEGNAQPMTSSMTN